MRIVSSSNLIANPQGIAVASDGSLIVANNVSFAPKRIIEVDPVSGAQTLIASMDIEMPRGLVVEPTGNILVVDYTGTLYRVDHNTGAATVVSTGGFLVAGAEGLALSPNGAFAYVGGYRRIVQVATATGVQSELPALPWPATQIVFESPASIVAVTDSDIVRIDLSAGTISQVGELMPDWLDDTLSVGDEAMTIDDAGRVWIGESWRDPRIFPVDPTAGGYAAVVAQPLLPQNPDPQFLVSGRPSCAGQCGSPSCGDGVVDPGEQCDVIGPSAECDPDCTFVLCGDALTNLAAGEACDDGNATSGDGCSDACGIEWRRAFLSGHAKGDIGVAGADEICQRDANAVPLNGTFVAWLSTSTRHAKDRLTGPDVEIRMPNGVNLADNETDLLDDDLDAPLTVNAWSGFYSGRTWTGTASNGLLSGGTCSDWTSTSGDGRSGDAILFDGGWTDFTFDPCNSTLRLYCFEVFDPSTGSVCGNGDVEAGEECDDGNTVGGDCCSASCIIEAVCVTGCGNGSCEEGEDSSNCPTDCGCASALSCDSNAQTAGGCSCDAACIGFNDCCADACLVRGRCDCGDGTYELGESVESCPADCAGPLPAVGLDFTSVTPCRVANTLTDTGPGGGGPERLLPDVVCEVTIGGSCGVPATAGAVAATIAVVEPAAAGYLTIYPSDEEERPVASSVNFTPGGHEQQRIREAVRGWSGFSLAVSPHRTHRRRDRRDGVL